MRCLLLGTIYDLLAKDKLDAECYLAAGDTSMFIFAAVFLEGAFSGL